MRQSFTRIITHILISTIIIGTAWYLLDDNTAHRAFSGYVIFGQTLTRICQQQCLTSAEFLHLKDVHERFVWIYLLLPTLIVLANKEKNTVKIAKFPKISLAIITVVLLSIALFFNQLFILFHYLIFPEGNWAFPYNSLLIQTYPEHKWLVAGCCMVILTFIFEFKYHLTNKQN